MDFRFTAGQEAFRGEVRSVLAQELPEGWSGYVGELQPEEIELDQHMRRRLAQQGWLALAWPG